MVKKSLKIFESFSSVSKRIFPFAMNRWYNHMVKLDKKEEVLFMNYGYDFLDGSKIKLNPEDERDLFGIQLYNNVVSSVDFKELDVLEIGCGKGGGCSYFSRYLNPKSVMGLDFCKANIKFCQKFYSENKLSFYQGDSQNVPFAEGKFDVVVNIESSHCYLKMDKFFNEVFRILKPGGSFLYADFRKKENIKILEKQLENSKLQLLIEEDITPNVMRALELDDERRKNLIQKLIPKPFHTLAGQFAGVRNSELYESFRNGKRKYLRFHLKK